MTNHTTQTTPAGPKPRNRLFNTKPFDLEISRVIAGKTFNTATATLACILASIGGSPHLDFHFERTGLYRSPRKQWFIAGEGGACSRWGRRAADGSRDHGDGIQFVSESEARRLLEQHDGPVEVFFECEEG